MIKVNMDKVQEAGTSNKLVAGGYVCKITNVVDMADKKYLLIEYDIAEGPYKDYYKELESAKGFWGGSYRRSYKEKALPFFKRMCSAVNNSNNGFVFDGGEQNSDESTLVGKLIGLVLYEEEYVKNNGDTGSRLSVDAEKSVEDIRKGNFKVREKVCIEKPSNSFVSVDSTEEEIPFS